MTIAIMSQVCREITIYGQKQRTNTIGDQAISISSLRTRKFWRARLNWSDQRFFERARLDSRTIIFVPMMSVLLTLALHIEGSKSVHEISWDWCNFINQITKANRTLQKKPLSGFAIILWLIPLNVKIWNKCASISCHIIKQSLDIFVVITKPRIRG